ncbi:MAG: response regulator transcription factor [Minwuia sp.]|uniref:response regulator transcription factor n=1 Tax=Minwuia sp. TaxID=2493630 RepID=UPI003A84B128
MRILIVEDDADLREGLRDMLEHASYAVDAAESAEEADDYMAVAPYDLVLLDVNLPGKDGVSLLKGWRRNQKSTPVVLLTARDGWREKVSGIDAGADDYITKPFHQEELLARVRAQLRRSGNQTESSMRFGDVEIDTAAQRVFVAGQDARLTAHEYRILNYLAHNTGRVISKNQIMDHVHDLDSEALSNGTEVLISRIRKKIGRDRIETVRGLGYRFKPAESGAG